MVIKSERGTLINRICDLEKEVLRSWEQWLIPVILATLVA
jgi:hypothetical protein